MSQPNPDQSVREQLRAKAKIAGGYKCGHCGYFHNPTDESVDAILTLLDQISTERFDPLRKYLSHYGTCSYVKQPLSDEPCTCGLDAALAALRQPTGEDIQMQCPTCQGKKRKQVRCPEDNPMCPLNHYIDCPTCSGKGVLPAPQSIGEQR